VFKHRFNIKHGQIQVKKLDIELIFCKIKPKSAKFEQQRPLKRYSISKSKYFYAMKGDSMQTTNNNKVPFWLKIIPPSILGLITLVFYYPSMKYPFQFDDLANITKKFSIRFADPLQNWWRSSRWMGEWLNRMNFEIGRFDPFYFRLTNIIVHIITGIFVFLLILEGCSRLKKSPFLSQYAFPIAFLTSGLFMLHPVQTQAVSYVIQARLEGLATLFVVANLFFILKAFQSTNMFIRYFLVAIALIVGFLSCGTKELAIMSPLLAILMDWFFLAEGEWGSFKKRIWFHALFTIVVFGGFMNILSAKYFKDIAQLKLTTPNNRGNVLTETARDLITPGHFLISEFKVILHYFQIFLWPLNMSVEYDWKLCDSFFSPDSFFPFLFLLILGLTGLYTLFKQKFSFVGFGIFWFLIAIAPRSTIIPSPELICDYKTYLSSIGWLFTISVILFSAINFLINKLSSGANIYKTLASHSLQLLVITILIIPIGYGAMTRNIVWSSSIEFWSDIVNKAPQKARGHNNLGVALSEGGKFEESIPHYLKAINLDRFYSDPWSNLAVAYSAKGETDKAIAALKQAIRIMPNYPEAYNNLGTLFIKKKEYGDAEKALQVALKLRPYYGKAFYNLGRLHFEQEHDEEAWAYFEKATKGDLDTYEGFFTLGQVSLKLKKFDEAAKAFEMALMRSVRENVGNKDQVLFNLANSYFMSKQFDKAEPLFNKLVNAYPHDQRFVFNLAETYLNQKNYDKASVLFKRLSEVVPQASFRYANCLERMNKYGEAREVLQKIVNHEKAPEEMKKMAQNDIGRLNIQEKINSGNCTLTMNELQQAFKTTTTCG